MRLALAALLVLACACGQPSRPTTPRQPALVHEAFVLDNGLRVLLLPDHATPIITVVTAFAVGSKDEGRGRTGFAHLFEHLMFEGSPHAPSGLFDQLAEEGGGWANAWTSTDQTTYQTLASPPYLETLLWLEADRLAGLADAVSEESLANQRDVVRNERRESYENEPYGIAGLLLPEALWPDGHPYHTPVIGDHEDLVAARLDDVKAFFHTWYAASNAVLVIAGDFEPAAARALVERYYGWIPAPVAPAHAPPPDPTPLTAEVRVDVTDDVQVPRVYLVWRGPRAYSDDEPALDLAARMLAGGGKAARLHRRLVIEERLAQEVAADLAADELAGAFEIVITAKPGVTIDRLVAICDEELAAFAADGPGVEELARARSMHESDFLFSLEPIGARAEQLAEYATLAGDPDFLARDLARYQAVTAADVRRVLGTYLGAGRVRLVVAPAEAE